MIKNPRSSSQFDLRQKRHFQRVEKRQFNWLTQNPYIVEKERELLLPILKVKPKKILEVGCGEGANIINLKKFGFKGEITGIDFSKAKISFAQKKASFAKLIEANAYSLPFEKEQFDLVFCKNLLHHLENKEKAISEMARVCRRGGKVVIIEGNGKNLIVIAFANLFKYETGMLNSTAEKLMDLIYQEKLLNQEEILMKEPCFFYRVLLHYRYGLPSLAHLTSLWARSDNFFSHFIPQSQSGFIVIKTERLKRPKKFGSLRGEREKVHFRRLLEKRKGLSWWAHTTPAGKARLERKGRIAVEHINPGAKVLEIGPGLGEFTRELSKTGAYITCLDITPELVKKAKERVKKKNVFFQEGDAHSLPFKANTFDFVVGSAILHHLDLEKALPEIKRVLKKRGKIIFFEPNLANPQVFLQKKIGLLKRISEASPEEIAFFRWSLQTVLEKAGFSQVWVKPFDFLHPLTPKVLVGWVGGLESFLEKTPLLKEFSGSLLIYGQAQKPTIAEIRKFWDQNPLYSMEIKEKPGTREFFRTIDQIKKNEVDKFALGLYQFPAARGKKVLDAGCGPGFLTRAYARCGANVTAIDLSPVAVKLTQQSLELLGLKGKVKVANLEKLPFLNESFDQAVCHGVIHHTPCPEKAIAEISRVAKKGGRVVIAVYFLSFWLKPFIFPLTRLALKIIGVKPVGRKSLATASSAIEFIRQYDGSGNPLTWALSRNEWSKLLTRYFKIERVESHFFPHRFILGKRRLPNTLSWFFDRFLGTMLYFSLVKE